MVDSPFSDSFDEGKFYTQSSDKHHHNEQLRVRVPGDWLHFASVVANSPLCPEYETVSDLARDGFAKTVKVALDKMDDPDLQAQWSTVLALQELERKNQRDARDIQLVELWRDRLRAGHSFTGDEFFRDSATLRNPEAIDRMANLATQFDPSDYS